MSSNSDMAYLGPLKYEVKYPVIKIEGFYKPKLSVPLEWVLLSDLLCLAAGSLITLAIVK